MRNVIQTPLRKYSRSLGRRQKRTLALCAALPLWALGCSDSTPESTPAQGGSAGALTTSGGKPSGGTSSGGASQGGAASGGVQAAGGTVSSGGVISQGGAPTTGGSSANGGSTSVAGSASGGTSGGAAMGGGAPAGGSSGASTGGGSAQGGGASGGSASGGTQSGGSCTPNASGSYMTSGDVVLDQRTCLHWMKESVSGMGLTAAKQYCEGLSRGGFDDWRVPVASEVASLMIKCGMYPPMDTAVFTLSGDGIWTTTESGTIAGNEPKVCGVGQNTGQYYDFGPVGAQHTRCVRGTGTFRTVKGCKEAQGCTNW